MADQHAMAYLIQEGFLASFLDGRTTGIIILVLLTFVTAIPTRNLARRKGRSVVGWMSIALFLPIIPLLLVWLLPGLPRHQKRAKKFV